MAQLSQQELDEIYAFALDIGKRAGKLLLDGVDKRIGGVDGSGELAFTEKDNAVDIVTKTDEGLRDTPFSTFMIQTGPISLLSYLFEMCLAHDKYPCPLKESPCIGASNASTLQYLVMNFEQSANLNRKRRWSLHQIRDPRTISISQVSPIRLFFSRNKHL